MCVFQEAVAAMTGKSKTEDTFYLSGMDVLNTFDMKYFTWWLFEKRQVQVVPVCDSNEDNFLCLAIHTTHHVQYSFYVIEGRNLWGSALQP